jgi:dihydroorotate dehydrogenase (fumarate)
VRMFYKILWESVKIIGCGWIKNGVDVFEHLLAGASLVQLGTVFWKENTACFARIESEFIEYVTKKWYNDISQIIWNLKEL